MGLLSFLSKKGSADGQPKLQPTKGQSYDTTESAPPPVLGTIPVKGNGPNTIRDLKRTAQERNQTKNGTGSNGPANAVSRFRSRSTGRPNTAPDAAVVASSRQRAQSAVRSRRDPSRAQPFLVNKRPGPPYLVGMTNSDHGDITDDMNGALPPVPPIASHFKQSSISTITSDTASISGSIAGTVRSNGGYVDILDAQGAFRPLDFRTRVKAAGARDYGEDVADRNMGVNGVDLTSPAVQAFYALTGGAQLVYKSDGSAIDVHGNKYAPGAIPVHLERMPPTTEATLDPKGKRNISHPTRTSSLEPRLATGGDAASRRKSVHGSALFPPPNSHATARPLSMHAPAAFADFSLDAASIPDIPRSRPNTGSSKASRPQSSGGQHQQQQHRESPLVPKDKSKSRRTRSGNQSTASTTYDEDTETDATRSYRTPQSHSPSKERSRSKKERRRQQELDYEKFGISTSDEAVPPVPPARHPNRSGKPTENRQQKTESRPQSQRSWKNPLQHLPIGQVRSDTSRPSSSSSSRPRNRSLGGASVHTIRNLLDDINEHVPNRTSSLSVSSFTPTVASSNQSSNLFPRPHSRNTANTSIDLAYTSPLKPPTDHALAIKNSRNTFGSIRGDSHESIAGTSNTLVSPVFDDQDDGYLTSTTDGSDIDSYIRKRRGKHRDDEGLIFNEGGYGGALPGLFDNLPTTFATPTPSTSSAAAASWDFRHTNSTAYGQRPATATPRGIPPRSHFLPSSFPAWEEDDSSSSRTVSEPDYDIPRAALKVPSFSDAGGNYADFSEIGIDSPIDDDDDDDIEAKFAEQLKKQIKRRERVIARVKMLQQQNEQAASDTV